MKNGKLWVGIPLIILVFSVILLSCEEAIPEEDILGDWYTQSNLTAGKPAFTFLSGKKLSLGGDTFDYTTAMGNNYTFTKDSSPRGTAKFKMDPEDRFVLIVSGSNSPIKNGTYYKLGYDGSAPSTPSDPSETYIAPPTATPPGNFYTTTQSVTLATTTSGASIKFTIDNSDPKNGQNYTVGTTTISISSPKMLRAIAFKVVDGETVYSSELIESYIIQSAGGGQQQPDNTVTVSSDDVTNPVAGSLRKIIADAADGTTIAIDSSVTSISLKGFLNIDKNITIQGNGVTITKADSGWSTNSGSFIEIAAGKTVNISRVRFKKAVETNSAYGLGGAIYNQGAISVDSCIFDENLANYGGAIYSTSKSTLTTVKGCTFYKNKANKWGGAIFLGGGNLYLTGNLFYQNTIDASGYGPVVDHNDSTNAVVYSNGYNVVDAASGGAKSSCGWSHQGTDKVLNTLVTSGAPFDTTTFVPVTALKIIVAGNVVNYPDDDFNGVNRKNNTTFAVGAVNATN